MWVPAVFAGDVCRGDGPAVFAVGVCRGVGTCCVCSWSV